MAALEITRPFYKLQPCSSWRSDQLGADRGAYAFAGAVSQQDGTLWTWGDNTTWGQLGDDTTVSKSSPIQIGALTNWAQVDGGYSHVAAVKTDGTMWTWGKQRLVGQLGDRHMIAPKSSPVQIGALTNWSQVSAGSDAHTAAVKTDGTMCCTLGPQ
jgi:hypothetical protein